MRNALHPEPADLDDPGLAALGRSAAITAIGFALYGFTTGCWRSPLMGIYVAAKMPLLIACTLACNWLLNGMIGLLLGSGLGFRQSLHALLGAFAISALILGSIAPISFFFALNAPPPDSPRAATAHATQLLLHTGLIGIAGVTGLVRLSGLLRNYCRSRSIASSTLAAWIAGNAFLGMQFSWIFRPFFGSPGLEVRFLRPNPMDGNFLDGITASLRRLSDSAGIGPGSFAILLPAAVTIALLLIFRFKKSVPKGESA